MKEKFCSGCNTVKPVTEFYKQVYCGYPRVYNVCKPCTSIKNREAYDRRRGRVAS